MLLLVLKESLSSSEELFLLSLLKVLEEREREMEGEEVSFEPPPPTRPNERKERRPTLSAAILFLLSASRSALVLLVSLSLIFSPSPRFSCFSAASALADWVRLS